MPRGGTVAWVVRVPRDVARVPGDGAGAEGSQGWLRCRVPRGGTVAWVVRVPRGVARVPRGVARVPRGVARVPGDGAGAWSVARCLGVAG